MPNPISSEQLQLLFEVTKKLATFAELDDVVSFATSRTRELFDADGCALILLDHDRKEFSFPVSSQKDSGAVDAKRLSEIRFPADQGIAGWVVAHDQATMVEDTSKDDRFFSGVDRETTIQTKSILCAPLRSGGSSIGVIQVINPAPQWLDESQLHLLEAVGNEVAVAYEKAALYERLRGEVVNLRRLCRGAGYALLAGAVLLGGLSAAAHRARVLPWSDLLHHQGVIVALLLLAGGATLAFLARERST